MPAITQLAQQLTWQPGSIDPNCKSGSLQCRPSRPHYFENGSRRLWNFYVRYEPSTGFPSIPTQFVITMRHTKSSLFQSSSMDSHPSALFLSSSPPFSSSSSSESLLPSATPTNLSFTSPSGIATLPAKVLLTALLVDVSHT
jgi:hypothetical protein